MRAPRINTTRATARPRRRRDHNTRQFELLSEIARIATLDLELRPMLQRITDALSRKFDWPFVACVSVDEQSRKFTCEALTSSAPTSVHIGYSRSLGDGVVGEVAETGQPILLDDVRNRENYVETLSGALSELCVPVLHHGSPVAILNIESTELGAFHDQLPLLETVAEQIAGAIASARRHEEVVRRAGLMEILAGVTRAALQEQELQPMLRSLVKRMQERAGLELVGVLLISDGGERFEIGAQAGAEQETVQEWARHGVPTGVVGRCIRTGEAQLVLDITSDPDYLPLKASVTSEYVVPVVHQDRLLGVLDLESASPAIFTPENLVVFRTLADQLAGAIHLATLNGRLADANRLIKLAQEDLEKTNHKLELANRKLETLSTTDALTGVANRRRFDERLEQEWSRATRTKTPVGLLMIDLDYFKPYNDTYGHRGGDECLRRVAEAIQSRFKRTTDLVARYGGEEFAVLLPGIDERTAVARADATREHVARLGITHTGSPFGVVTVSAGVSAIIPPKASPSSMLVETADQRLYEAKRSGRNRVGGS